MLVLVETNDLGSGAPLLRDLPRDALRRHRRGRSFVARGVALFVAGAALVYHVVAHVRERVDDLARPVDRPAVYCPQRRAALRQDCASYQLVQSLYSIANGGFGGTGLGKGTFTTTGGDRADPVPEHRLHLLGARAGARARRRRRRCCSSTCSSSRAASGSRCSPTTASRSCSPSGSRSRFALQTFIIVGGVLRVIPLTGITLPFVSYGGSSVVANFVLLAGLLLVSNRANARRRAMNRQITRLAVVGARPARRAHRRARRTGRPGPPASLADRQDNAIQRVAQFTIKRGLIYAADGTILAANRQREGRRPDALLPPLPAGRPRRRTSSATRRRSRSRAGLERVAERLPDRRRTANLEHRARHDARQAPAARRSRATTSRLTIDAGRAAGRAAARSAGKLRRRRRARPAHRRGAGDGLVARLRPEPGREGLRRGSAASAPTCRAGGAAAQPRHRTASTRPGSTFKVVTRRGRARLRHVHARLDASTTPATASSTASRSTTSATRTGPRSSAGQLPAGARSTRSTPSSARSARSSARAGSSTTPKRFGFYADPPLETPGERARAERPLRRTASSSTRATRRRRSTRAGSRSARSGCW